MTTEDFKQLMLFKVMDYPFQEWAKYLTMDGYGRLRYFDNIPYANIGNQLWMVRGMDIYQAFVMDDKTNEWTDSIVIMDIPPDINWKECIIEL